MSRPPSQSRNSGERSTRVEWPPDRFYWAVLDGAVLTAAGGGRGRKRERLGYMFESVLPGLPIESMQAAYVRLPGKTERYLACGVPRAVLAERGDDEATMLGPSALPDFVADEIDPRRINLLTGAFLAAPVRRAGRRLMLAAAIGIVVCAALVTIGLERRVRAVTARSVSVAGSKMALYERVLGSGVHAAVGTSFPPERRLVAELRRLEETRGDPAPVRETVRCAHALAAVLARWPADVRVQTHSIQVQPTTIGIRGSVPTMGDAQDLADALSGLSGWSVGQPQTQASDDGVEFTLAIKPASGALSIRTDDASASEPGGTP